MFNTQQQAQEYALKLSPAKLVALLEKFDEAYYYKKSLVRDELYDVIREVAQARQGESKIIVDYLKKIGHKPKRQFVDLPYRMPSLDKIKPDNGSVAKWAKGKREFVLIDKMDGISSLMDYEDQNLPDIYTRGSDDEGQIINRLRPHLQIPTRLKVDIAVRGEIIMEESTFYSKYAEKYENPRNLVIGVTGRLKGDTSAVKDLDVLAYEIKGVNLKPSDQLAMLKKLGFHVPTYKVVTHIDDESLTEYLAKRRKESPYEIDGIVIHNNVVSKEEESGNPKNSIAFKVNTSDEMVEVEVLSVTWQVSKHGKINPQINIKPTRVKGVTISNVTGHNAFFITHGYGYAERTKYAGKRDRPIGKGAVLRITRSGDVIPKVDEVVVAAKKPDMPSIPYEWDENKVAIYVSDKSQAVNIRIKKLTHFFTTLDVEGLKEANVKLLVDNGYTTIPSILKMTKDDFLELPRMQTTMATKLTNNIKEAMSKATLELLADATGLFGEGMGERRCKVVFDAYPDILTKTPLQAKKLILDLPGFSDKTTDQFVGGMERFAKFLNTIKFVAKKKSVGNKYKDWNVCFTGVRDKNIEEIIKSGGGKIASGVTSNTTLLVVKSLTSTSDKMTKAKAQGIKIITLTDLQKQLKG